MKPRHAPPAFPEALDGDDDDVAWPLSTGGVEWNRGAHEEALVWLRRAIEAAREHRRLNRARDLEFRARTLQVALEVGWVAVPSSSAPPTTPTPEPRERLESIDPDSVMELDIDVEEITNESTTVVELSEQELEEIEELEPIESVVPGRPRQESLIEFDDSDVVLLPSHAPARDRFVAVESAPRSASELEHEEPTQRESTPDFDMKTGSAPPFPSSFPMASSPPAETTVTLPAGSFLGAGSSFPPSARSEPALASSGASSPPSVVPIPTEPPLLPSEPAASATEPPLVYSEPAPIRTEPPLLPSEPAPSATEPPLVYSEPAPTEPPSPQSEPAPTEPPSDPSEPARPNDLRDILPDSIPAAASPAAAAGPEASTLAPEISGIALSAVAGLQDLPEDAQAELVRTAAIQELNADEEISGFGLALVLDGSVAVMPTVADVAAVHAAKGQPVFSQGHLAEGVAVRVVAGRRGARVAAWDRASYEAIVRDFPWVKDELQAVGDRFQALAGVCMGPLGENLDDMLRGMVFDRCEVRYFLPGEILAEGGRPVSGMYVIGGGHVDLVEARGDQTHVVSQLGSGDFLFASQILMASSAPQTARAGSGGALALFAARPVAHELMLSVPPLLELFAR